MENRSMPKKGESGGYVELWLKRKCLGAEEAILDVGLINFAIIHNVE